MTTNQHKSISKFLSLVLRHRPEVLELEMDEAGWVAVDELIAKAQAHGKSLNVDLLVEVVTHNNKQRFTFNADQTKIRANQGHSIDIDLELEAVAPPTILYHGTASRFLDSIRQQGLIKGNRQHVHLTTDRTVAKQVGARHGSGVVLEVLSAQMYDTGYSFYLSQNGVWLTEHVPPQFIRFPGA